MSNLLWDRVYKLTVGSSTGGIAAEFTDLHIEFSVEKSDETHADKADIKLYNVAPDTINSFLTEDNIATLYVGYGSDPQQVFSGQIDVVSVEQNDADIVVSFTFSDGRVEMVESTTDTHYPAGTTLDSVLSDLSKKMGFSYVSNNGNYESGTGLRYIYPKGISVSGNIKNWIDSTIKGHDLKYFVSNKTAYCIPVNSPTGAEIAVVFTPTSGLVGSPHKKNVASKINKKKKSKDVREGVEFKALMSPEVSVGSLVKVESKFVTGIYQVTKVRHRGSYRGSEWFTEVEGILPASVTDTETVSTKKNKVGGVNPDIVSAEEI